MVVEFIYEFCFSYFIYWNGTPLCFICTKKRSIRDYLFTKRRTLPGITIFLGVDLCLNKIHRIIGYSICCITKKKNYIFTLLPPYHSFAVHLVYISVTSRWFRIHIQCNE